ncbi:AraC family transcriptional regulator [Shimazuella sp. AN120528]|uniref:AraC family transcriptional regulator n=1 Tax=Shimazuella soli TaxID=1892854 RepID=UPI001F0E3719|nr:AraC family transcriptional regulator [Shimazuella soli]MCH5586407.1 AraC family transcriptional regulator [Shimazuella soli]
MNDHSLQNSSQRKPTEIQMIGKPVLHCEELGWKNIEFSQWIQVKPQEAYAPPMDKHLIVVHMTPQPVKMRESADRYQYEGYVHAGEINVLSSGEESFCAWDRDLTFLRLEIHSSFLHQIADQTNFSYHQQIELEHSFHQPDSKIFQISQWLLDEFRKGAPNGTLYFDSLANLLGIHLLQNYTAKKIDTSQPDVISKQQINRILEFLHAYYQKNFTLEELSTAVHISSSHLVRLFKEATHLTPHQYLIKIRIDHAKQLLEQPELSIGEIAHEVGFFDQSHFYRYFKRIVGITPRAYRNQQR